MQEKTKQANREAKRMPKQKLSLAHCSNINYNYMSKAQESLAPNDPACAYAVVTLQQTGSKDVADLVQSCEPLQNKQVKHVCICCKHTDTLEEMRAHIEKCVLHQYRSGFLSNVVLENAVLEDPVIEEVSDIEDASERDDEDDLKAEDIVAPASASDPDAGVLASAPVDRQDWIGPAFVKEQQRAAFMRMAEEVAQRIKKRHHKEISHENVSFFVIIIIVSWRFQWIIFGIYLTFSFVRQVSNPCKKTINLPLTVFHFAVSCVRYTIQPHSCRQSQHTITVCARVLWEQKPRASRRIYTTRVGRTADEFKGRNYSSGCWTNTSRRFARRCRYCSVMAVFTVDRRR